MTTYDIYGVESGDLEEVRIAIESILGIKFAPHESSFWGDYFLGIHGEEEYKIIKNMEPISDDPFYEPFPKNGILLYIDKTNRADELETLLLTGIPGLRLLHRTER